MEINQKNMRKNSMKAARRLDLVFIIAMLAIPCLYWLVFWLGVNLNSILMAFKNPEGEWSMISIQAVFLEIQSPISTLGIAVKNTLTYFIKDFFMLILHLCIAYFFYKKIVGKRIFQIIFYLPSIISAVALTTVYSRFIRSDGPLGIIAQIVIKNFNPDFKMPILLANSETATWTILAYTVWIGWGGNMLLLGGAFARIPLEIIESAKLDGIGTVKEITHIMIPLMWPTVSTILILMMTSLFLADGPILLFTKGQYSTQTIGYWIFDLVYNSGSSAYNTVAAAGLMFTLIGLPVILGFRWLIEKVPTVEY